MRRWTWSALVQVMAWRLFGWLRADFLLILSLRTNFSEIRMEIQNVSFIWKCRLQKWRTYFTGGQADLYQTTTKREQYVYFGGRTVHYNDVVMGAMASQITSLTFVYSSVYSGADQKKTSKLRVTGLCAWNSPVTGEFPAQMASNAENVSISWRHHGVQETYMDDNLIKLKDETYGHPIFIDELQWLNE